MSERVIIVFKDSVTPEQVNKYAEEVKQSGGTVNRQFDSDILNGFSATVSESFLSSFKSVQGDAISYIEPDSIVTTQ